MLVSDMALPFADGGWVGMAVGEGSARRCRVTQTTTPAMRGQEHDRFHRTPSDPSGRSTEAAWEVEGGGQSRSRRAIVWAARAA